MPPIEELIEYTKQQIELAQQGVERSTILGDKQHYRELEQKWVSHYLELVKQDS